MLEVWGPGSSWTSEPRPARLAFTLLLWKAEVLTNACKATSSIFLPILITFLYLWLLPHLPSPLFSLFPNTCYSDRLAIIPPGSHPCCALFWTVLFPITWAAIASTSLRLVFNCPCVQRGHLSNPIADLPTRTPCPLYNSFLAITLITIDTSNIIRLKIYLFIYLVALGLSYDIWNL